LTRAYGRRATSPAISAHQHAMLESLSAQIHSKQIHARTNRRRVSPGLIRGPPDGHRHGGARASAAAPAHEPPHRRRGRDRRPQGPKTDAVRRPKTSRTAAHCACVPPMSATIRRRTWRARHVAQVQYSAATAASTAWPNAGATHQFPAPMTPLASISANGWTRVAPTNLTPASS